MNFLTSCASALVLTPLGIEQSVVEPLAGFVANRGQWESEMRFCARDGSLVLAICDDGFLIHRIDRDAPSESVRFRFADQPSESVRGDRELPALHHFYLGDDPAQWFRDVPGFERVILAGAMHGVDAVVRKEPDGFHYDFEARDGRSLKALRIRCEGALVERIDDLGNLILRTPFGIMRHLRPRASSMVDASDPVPCAFRIFSESEFGFEIEAPPGGVALDPGIEWSTLLGGSTYGTTNPSSQHGTVVRDVKVLDDQSTLVTGSTGHVNFPTTPGVLQGTFGGEPDDVFVTRLGASGSALVFSTFLGGKKFPFPIGGAGIEVGEGIHVAPDGTIVIGGWTSSANFPSTPGAFSTPSANHQRAFACRISADGSTLLASSLFSAGSPFGFVNECAISETGGIALAGDSHGPGLPLSPGAFDFSFNGVADGFVVALTPDLTGLVLGTYLGGSASEGCNGVDYRGTTIGVIGSTQSTDFPTTSGALDGTMDGLGDAFVAKLDAPTGALLYSSFVGGTSADGGALIAFDGYGNAIIGGGTNSLDFPTTPHSFMPTPWPIPLGDCFIARLNSTGSALDFATYFGGVEGEEIWDLRADDDGFITFCGTSHSDQAGFPTTPGAIEEDWISPYAHGFVSRLLRDGRTLAYSTAIGGTSAISGAIVTALDSGSTGAVTFGAGAGPDYPITPGAFDSVQNQSGNKAAVTRIDMLPTGVTRIGASTPGCLGPLAVGVILNPKAGTKTFEVTCTRGPKFGSGHLIVSSSKLAIPILASGATLYVDPAAATLVPVSTDDLGFARRALPLRHSLQGSKGYVQFVFPDPCAAGGWSASPALEILVQP